MKYVFVSLFCMILFSSILTVNASVPHSNELCLREIGSFFFLTERKGRGECKKYGYVLTLWTSSGNTGAMWPIGPVGATGATWPQWMTWADWPIWPQGIPGLAGEKWEKGETGSTGPMGERGPEGLQGEKWEIWDAGPIWPKWEPWVQGEVWPKGDPWEPWAIGPMGPRGSDGAPGISGYEIIQGEVSIDDELQKTVTANCPSGKVVIGWWFLTLNVSNSNEVVITRSYPSSQSSWEVKWWVDGTTAGDESFSLQSYAICVSINDF